MLSRRILTGVLISLPIVAVVAYAGSRSTFSNANTVVNQAAPIANVQLDNAIALTPTKANGLQTASTPQKQPPANTAVCKPLAVVGAMAIALSNCTFAIGAAWFTTVLALENVDRDPA